MEEQEEHSRVESGRDAVLVKLCSLHALIDNIIEERVSRAVLTAFDSVNELGDLCPTNSAPAALYESRSRPDNLDNPIHEETSALCRMKEKFRLRGRHCSAGGHQRQPSLRSPIVGVTQRERRGREKGMKSGYVKRCEVDIQSR